MRLNVHELHEIPRVSVQRHQNLRDVFPKKVMYEPVATEAPQNSQLHT